MGSIAGSWCSLSAEAFDLIVGEDIGFLCPLQFMKVTWILQGEVGGGVQELALDSRTV